MKDILYRLKHVRLWRWILASAFLLGLAFDAYSVLSNSGTKPNFYEMLLKQTNDVSTLILYFIFLLIIFDIGYDASLPDTEASHRIVYDFFYIYFLTFLFLLLIIIINIFALLLKSGSINFSNSWAAAQSLINNGVDIPALEVTSLSPISAAAISFLLFFLRFGFINAIVFVINRNCKKRPWGYTGGMVICLTDAVAYFTFNMVKPTGVFPFEHSFIGSALKLTSSIALNIIISVLYWIVLTVLAGSILYLSGKQKKLRTAVR